MKATRILFVKNLNKGKYQQLSVQAERLGKISSEVWHSFGSISGVSIKSDKNIRDQWLSNKREFNVSANAWIDPLRDSFGDIKANRFSSKEKVRKILYKQVSDDEKRVELYKKLK